MSYARKLKRSKLKDQYKVEKKEYPHTIGYDGKPFMTFTEYWSKNK